MGVLVFSQISGAPHEDAIRAELVRKQAERQAVMVRRTQEHFNDYTQKQAENKTGCADVGFRFDTNPVQNKITKTPKPREQIAFLHTQHLISFFLSPNNRDQFSWLRKHLAAPSHSHGHRFLHGQRLQRCKTYWPRVQRRTPSVERYTHSWC